MDWKKHMAGMPEKERAYAQGFPLHALSLAYTSGAMADDDVWLSKFRSFIEQGHDVNQHCCRNMTIWEQLSPRRNLPFHRIDRAAALLVKAGFNPLLQMSGQRFSKPCSFLSYCFLEPRANSANSGLAIGAIQALADLEQSAPLRSESGGNFLHVLSKETPQAVPSVLLAFTAQPNPSDGRFPIPAHWLGECDGDGKTPLALLWDERGQAARIGSEDDPAMHEISMSSLWLWMATDTLAETKDSLLAHTHQGRALWQVIAEHLNRYPANRRSVPPRLAARLSQVCLEEQTPSSRNHPRSIPRL